MKSSSDKPSFETYLSPFTWRYGSDPMRRIWSEQYKRLLWRRVWVALAKAQYKQGLVRKKELDDLVKHQNSIDIEKAHEIEREIRHDLMAEIKTFASQAKIGGRKLHLGATSMDIEDNADVIRYKEALMLIEKQIKKLLAAFKVQMGRHKGTACMGYTHLQPAEPTTIGYRFALYAQDLLYDLSLLRFTRSLLKGKGIKGAVGTSASFVHLLSKQKALAMEKDVARALGIDVAPITSQTAPRKLEWLVTVVLSSLAQSLYKFAFDLRVLQSPGFGELSEPFGEKQVGSSAMPFKKNPWKSEQICSLARFVMIASSIPQHNAAHMLLERTLDDSANRRIVFPELFLAVDEILESATRIVKNLQINTARIQYNLALHGIFSATEAVLMEAVKKGGDRQEIHERLRIHALAARREIENGNPNPLFDLLRKDGAINRFVSPNILKKLLDPGQHTGRAKENTQTFLRTMPV